MTTKWCRDCNTEKSSSDFSSGCAICRPCKALECKTRREKYAQYPNKLCPVCNTEKHHRDFVRDVCKVCRESRTTKECYSCGLEKSIDLFKRETGLCKECVRIRNKEYNETNRVQLREKAVFKRSKRKHDLLSGKVCARCGFDDIEVFEFAHRDRREKKNSISYLLGCAKRETLIAEVEKCEVLCGNCHRKETHAEDNTYKHVFVTTGMLPYRHTEGSENRRFILDYLQERCCEQCGEEDIRVLEFDHIDPSTKKMSVSDMTANFSLKMLQDEIEKTRILCRNCHKRHTATQQVDAAKRRRLVEWPARDEAVARKVQLSTDS